MTEDLKNVLDEFHATTTNWNNKNIPTEEQLVDKVKELSKKLIKAIAGLPTGQREIEVGADERKLDFPPQTPAK